MYHSVCSGCQFGNSTGFPISDFPTTRNAKSRVNGSQNCNNAAFKFDLSSLRANFQTNSLKLDKPGFNNVCFPDTIVFENLSTGGRTIRWNLGDGTLIDQTSDDPRSIIHQYKATGKYPVKLRITDLSTCSQTDSITKVINYFRPEVIVGQDAVVCEGQTFQLTASGAATYRWTSSIDKQFLSTDASPFIQPKESGFYFLSASDANGCTKKDTVTIGVNKNVRADFQTYDLNFRKPGYNNVCYPEEIRFKNLSFKGENYVWNFDDGTRILKPKTDTLSIIHGFKQQGAYRVKLKAVNNATCNKADSIVKIINYFKNNVKANDDAQICEGSNYTLTAPGAILYDWFNADRSFVSINPAPVVQPKTTTTYFVNTADGNGCKKKDTAVITVLNKAELKWQYRIKGSCLGRPTVLVQNQTLQEEGFTYRFDFGDGVTSSESELEHTYKEDGTYRLSLVGQNKFCSTEESVSLPMYT
ncbi:MAG: PKD domain-containing protein, partial [Flammeovirgaceae bacterium]